MHEFLDYLVANHLTDLIGLEVFGAYGDPSMYELILNKGTLILQADAVKNCKPTRVTGWKFKVGPDYLHVCQDIETHSSMTSGNPQGRKRRQATPKA